MPKISDQPLERCHLRLFSSDLRALRAMYPNNTTDAARNIIHAFVLAQQQRTAPAIDALPALDIDADALNELLDLEVE